MLTAGNAITQDISKASAGVRTIALRIAGTEEAKNQLVEMGEDTDDFIVATHAKMQELIKDYTAVASNAYEGVDILDANGNLKDTYTILLDIAKVYQEILDTDKKAGTNRGQALVEAIAGKNRSNIAASILLNPQMLEDVYNKALQSENSATEELDKYLDSLEGHLAQLKNAGQEVIYDLQASDDLKTLIDLGTKLLGVIDKIVETLGTVPSILGALGTLGIIKNSDKLASVLSEIIPLFSNLGLAGTAGFGAVGVAAGIAIKAVIDAKKGMDDLRESSQEYADNYIDAKSSIEEYKTEIESLQQTIADSNTTYEESKTARERLYDIQSTLIENYGTEKQAIDLITQAINGEIDALDELTAKQWQKQKNDFNAQNLEGWDAWVRWTNGNADNNIDMMLNQIEGTIGENGVRNGKRITLEASMMDKSFLDQIAKLYGGVVAASADGASATLDFVGNAYDLVEVLEEVQIKSNEAGDSLSTTFKDSLEENVQSLEKITSEWQSFYDLFTLNETILGGDYKDEYGEYIRLVENYQKALTNPNQTKESIDSTVAELRNAYYELRTELDSDNTLGQATKDSILRAFDNIAPELQSQFGKIELEADVKTTGLQTFVNDIKKNFGYVEDVLHYDVSSATESQVRSYTLLEEKAKQYGMSVEGLINALKELGLVESKADIEFAEKTKNNLRELYRITGGNVGVAEFEKATASWDNDHWIEAAEHMDELKKEMGLTKVTAEELAPSFENATESVSKFLSGGKDDNGNDIPSELEHIQAALADTRNMSAETYSALVSHSQKYSNAVSIENGRLVVNRERLLGIANSRVKEQRETLKQVSNYKKLEYLKRFRELKMYDEKLVDTTSDTYKNAMALQDQITQLDLLSNQLDIASDSFERFKEAQSTENAPDYDTGMGAYNAIKEGLTSGKVGTDDFKYATQALMSVDEYKKFVALSKEGYEAQYEFMESWRKTNSKFFTEDDRQNAIAWQEYLKETGLLQDGMIASSEEIGEKAGLSYDAVNALNQNLNQFSFGQDIITQTQIDYVDEATEATMNLANAKQALAEAEEGGADENLITGLKEDVEKAQADYDTFIEGVPEKFAEAQKILSEGKAKSISEALFGEKESDALSFTETIGTHIDELNQQLRESGLSPERYREINAELEKFQSIQQQIKQEAIDSRNRNIGEDVTNIQDQKKRLAELRTLQAQASSETAIAEYQSQINAVKESIASLDGTQVMIDIELNKEALDQEIESIQNDLDSLEQKKISVASQTGGGTAAYQMEQGKAALQSKLEQLQGERATLESTIKFVKDEASVADVQKAKDELEEPVDTKVNVEVKGLDTVKTLKETLSTIKSELSNIQVSVTASVSGGGSILKSGGTVAPDAILQRLGIGGVNGTAHADGTWGLPKNEEDALVGELKPEGLVRDGKFYLIGKNGPERRNLKKGDVIFNGEQTEELLKNGYATERGTLIGSGHVSGTVLGNAYVNANNQAKFIDIKGGGSTVSKAAKQATDDIKDDIDEVEKESEEQTDNFIDWIERRIKHFSTYAERYLNQAQKALDKVTNTLYSGGQKGVKAFKVFDKTIDSLYKTASNSQRDLMEVQQEAYTAYTNLTNAVGLDPEYQNRIKYGLMEIENVTDETLKDQISKYQDYYDKSQEALDNFIEAAEKFYHLPIDKAAEKIENLSNKIEYLGKVSDNTIGYKNKNEILKEQDKQQRLTYKAQKQANKETQKNLKTAKKQAKKETKDQINEQIKRTNAKLKQEKAEVKSKKALASADKAAKKEIKQATKSNKAIDLSKLQKGTKAYKEAKQYNAALTDKANSKLSKKELKTGNVLNLENFEEGSAAYKAVVKYNAAINAQTEAWNNAKNAEEEYLHWHQVEYPKAAFDNIAADFNHTVEMMNHDFTDYGNQINELVKAGKKVSTGYYRAQKDINALKMEEYVMERDELETQLGQIQRYSDEWYDAYNQIKEVDNQISQLKISTMELNEAMRQLYLDSFQGMRNDIEALIGEQEFLLSLMSHNKKTDNEIGYFTDEGLVNLTSGVATATMAQAKQRNTASEIKELQDLLDKGELKWRDTQFESIDQLKDQIRELYGTWQSEIKDTYDAQSSIVDLMKERYQAELEMYKDLVSSKKEALSAEKDLYEYQKKIAEKTKNIALLEKQLAAYAGDSSQEGQAKRQKLQSDLNKAQEDLRDTEYDKYISDQQQMLDDLIGEYEDRIEKKLNDFNGLLAEGIAISSEQGQETIDALNQIAKDNGYVPLKMDTFNSNLSGTVEGQTEAFQSYFNDVFGASGASKVASLVTNSQSVIDKVNKITNEDGTVKAEASVNTDNLNDDTDNNKFLKAIKDSNAADTRDITDAIKTIGGQSATKNAEDNDPVAQAKKEQAAKEAVSSVAPAVSTASTIADIQTALTSVSAGTAKSSINNTEAVNNDENIKKQANDFIKKNAKAGRANKNGKDFGPVNKQIAKFMGTEGKSLDKMKVLTTAELD